MLTFVLSFRGLFEVIQKYITLEAVKSISNGAERLRYSILLQMQIQCAFCLCIAMFAHNDKNKQEQMVLASPSELFIHSRNKLAKLIMHFQLLD